MEALFPVQIVLRINALTSEFFDALYPDARYLYLIEHLGRTGSGHYQVRVYDSAAGALMPGAIVDKRNVGEAMEGRAVATLQALALCADLPNEANAIFEYLEIFRNRQLRHSALGMLTPVEFETRHQTATVA